MDGSVQAVAEAIRDIVSTSGSILGSRLSAEIGKRFPGWKPAHVGAQSLKEFVAAHLKDVRILGRAGMDVRYGLQGVESQSDPRDVNFWRVWVSPNSSYSLVVDLPRRLLRAITRPSDAKPGEILLERPSPEMHKEIARAFCSELPPGLQEALKGTLDDLADKYWWQTWVRQLKGTEHIEEWNNFRRLKLEEIFSTHLQSIGATQQEITGVLRCIREQATTRLPEKGNAGDFLELDSEGMLRHIISEVVQRMSVADLRDLKLPIGTVLDVLAKSKSR